MKMFLGNFLQDWWNAIRNFIRGWDTTVYALVIAAISLMALLCLMRFLKPTFSADKNKFRVLPIVMFVIFIGLLCLVLFI